LIYIYIYIYIYICMYIYTHGIFMHKSAGTQSLTTGEAEVLTLQNLPNAPPVI
jgi:hypothetical protein